MSNNEFFDFKFYKWEKKFHDRPFLRQPFGNQWEEYTWEEAGKMARKLAAGLKSIGLRDNAHIGLISKNCREWIIADMAIMMAGYVSVPFFPSLKGEELEYLIDFGDVDLLFVGKIETWDDIESHLPKEFPLIRFPHYKSCSVVDRGEEWFDFINKYDPLQEIHVPKLTDLWTIIFTSGTTGNPKGVELSYLALDSTKIITEQVNPLKIDFSGNNDFISYLPLNHIAERVVVEHVCLRFGGTISFVESLDTFATNLKDIQPHVFFAAPRIWTKFQMGILAKVPQKKLATLLKIPIVSSFIKQTKIIGCPIIRENDGLAMSSRNSLLTSNQRKLASKLFECLQLAKLNAKKIPYSSLKTLIYNFFEKNDGIALDYFIVANPKTLKEFDLGQPINKGRIFIAAILGKIRLIDNLDIS